MEVSITMAFTLMSTSCSPTARMSGRWSGLSSPNHIFSSSVSISCPENSATFQVQMRIFAVDAASSSGLASVALVPALNQDGQGWCSEWLWPAFCFGGGGGAKGGCAPHPPPLPPPPPPPETLSC